jgi:phytoene dehydrogenase-like protein
VTVETNALVNKILVENGRVDGAMINGKPVKTRAVVSNGNLVRTVRDLVGLDHFGEGFRAMTDGIKLSNSSCQVYIGLKPGEKIEPIGDLLFTSEYPEFDADAICSRDITSRTYSVYYPEIRPGSNQYTVVASMNARYDDWDGLDREAYRASKKDMIEDTLDHLDRYIPGIRGKVDYTEAGTPRTFERYTLHEQGASFGTKFEGLDVSTKLSEEIPGLFHTGSVGIIMSGWLGSVNYGVIKASEVEKYLGGLE